MLGDGIVTRASHYPFDDTLARLERVFNSRRVKVFAIIDHSGEAARVGLVMPPTKVLIVGNPAAGTPVMLSAPSTALDLPIRILVADSADGHTLVSFNSAAYLEARHGFAHELAHNLAAIDGLVTEALE